MRSDIRKYFLNWQAIGKLCWRERDPILSVLTQYTSHLQNPMQKQSETPSNVASALSRERRLSSKHCQTQVKPSHVVKEEKQEEESSVLCKQFVNLCMYCALAHMLRLVYALTYVGFAVIINQIQIYKFPILPRRRQKIKEKKEYWGPGQVGISKLRRPVEYMVGVYFRFSFFHSFFKKCKSID